jgi:hypothetical protein
LFELADHSLALRLSLDDETSIPCFPTEMRETQEIERLGTIKPALFSAFPVAGKGEARLAYDSRSQLAGKLRN